MKQFNSFLEGISYHPKCVLCKSILNINDRDLATDFGSKFREGRPRVSFYLSAGNDDVVSIIPETDEIVMSITEKRVANYDGTFYHGLTIDCKSCCQFSYTLQIQISLTQKKLIGTFLNSESLSIEDNNMVHEIKNIYSTEKTEYAHFHKDGSSKKTSMPLIVLNLSDPKETIARIRKLLIFS